MTWNNNRITARFNGDTLWYETMGIVSKKLCSLLLVRCLGVSHINPHTIPSKKLRVRIPEENFVP